MIKKITFKSIPQNALNQINMILGWFLSKLYLTAQPFIQDGHCY